MNDLDLMLRFLLQAIVVLGACRVAGFLGRRFLGQTQVVMEMVTGVLLGPSLFGLLLPEVQHWLFPANLSPGVKHPSMSVLYVIAQIGLILYMFVVGTEFDARQIGGRVRGAIGISLAGIVAPFLLGAILASLAMPSGGLFFAPEVPLTSRMMYLGAAMSITAFPMLARIILERGIAGTRMGTLVLAAGATDDAVAWSLLAIVLAIAKSSPAYAIVAIVVGILFAAATLTVGRSLLTAFARKFERDGHLSSEVFAGVLITLLVGAYVTDAIGIYAVFGAFLVGVAMPRGSFAQILRERISPVAGGLFLPFFFIYSGLNTRLDSISGAGPWLVAGLVLIAAIVGKGVACALAARAAGEPWRDSWAIGALMNARGLMELIILNIGLSQGIITPALFTIMVLMAIVTTLMTSPIFLLIMRRSDSGSPPLVPNT